MGTSPQYVFKEAQTVQPTDIIPILDLGPLLRGEPDALPALAKEVSDKKFDRGILVCGTGAGMAIVANKVKGE